MLNCILLAVTLTHTATTLPEPQVKITSKSLIDTQVLLVDIKSELEQQMQRLTLDITQNARDGVLHSNEMEGLVTAKD
ncbi:hypothetical protein L5M18_12950 [Shewanella sp. SM20]|uniref:hypothetical protein n=1 Tax=Shewanella TaxID=22 RepID=UPI0021DB4FBD|nr:MULTISPECIES: hypothetical protein [unclassified Shewanella]MCU7964645.1 hypothetical protein [Shewanella sp. SW32]MCU7972570.1 hypothetical protein [Shewanella sp. SW29]MCU8092467.1 hypothetical protein [Shewanella sp. SM20]